jgi:oxaloacetate decarboxylase alpha subunit
VAGGETLNAPLAGNIFKVLVNAGDKVDKGDVVIIMEAMKMETEIRAVTAGEIASVSVREGDSVSVGEPLLNLV